MTQRDDRGRSAKAEVAIGGSAPGAPPILLTIGLLLTVALIGAGIIEKSAATAGILLHMLLRIYDGRFSGARRWTWLIVVLGFFASFAIGFLGYVLPWGQLSFWLAAHFGEPGWRMAQTFVGLGPFVGGIMWLAIIADMIALHAVGVSRRRLLRNVALLALVFVMPGILSDVLHLVGFARPAPPRIGDPLLTPRKIMPDLDELLLFAVLRSVPNKMAGLGLVVILLLLPLASLWTRAWRFHAPRTRIAWTLATALVPVSWIGLGFLGSLPPAQTEGPQWTVLVLVAYQALFFLVVPLVLGRYARPQDQRTLVFE